MGLGVGAEMGAKFPRIPPTQGGGKIRFGFLIRIVAEVH